MDKQPPSPLWSRADTVAAALITLFAAILRAVRLGAPARPVFDEAFYVRDVCAYARVPPDLCRGVETQEVHPPLAKWLITAGVEILGYGPVGWRVASVVAGAVTVLAFYALARWLLESATAAAASAALLALDPLHFVMSRVAMLDIFLVLFSTIALALVVLDRAMKRGGGPRPGYWPLLGAGASAGAATACKWSGAFALIAGVVFTLNSASQHSDANRYRDRLVAAARGEGKRIAACLLVVPAAVYLCMFIGAPSLMESEENWAEGVANRHVLMLNFHRHLTDGNIAVSRPWTWPLIKRPVPYYAQKDADRVVEVWFGGNPLVWWPSLVALGWAGLRWIRARDRRQTSEGVIVGGFLFMYAPWFLLAVPPLTWGRHLVFIFYLLPAVPFMCLAVGWALTQLPTRAMRAGAISIFAGAVGFLGFYYPILAAVPIDHDAWAARTAVFTSCERPKGALLSAPVTVTRDRRVLTSMRSVRLQTDDPPYGWCWR